MAKAPFQKEHELYKQSSFHFANDEPALRGSSLPGQPRIVLAHPGSLGSYLLLEHLTPDLDRLAPRLWLVSTPRYWHISPLHAQAVRGRNIVLTENPQLHLVWYYDRIFIKPVPRYMLARAFWEYIESQSVSLQRALTGFMRSYALLIRYESDFRLATSESLGLIPNDDGSETTDGTEKITFARFRQLIASFEDVSDDLVNPRYRYGELRLSRLNLCARIFLGKLTFHHIDAQWGPYLGSFLAPFLSLFAIVSVALSAMQVELGVQGSLLDSHAPWTGFALTSRWFSCVVLIIVTVTIVFFSALLSFLLLHDIWFARSVLRQRRRDPTNVSTQFKSGVV